MRERPTVLLCTSNGVGLGHLSRVMAVGEALQDSAEVVVFTMSAAVSIPVSRGFRTEYLRSREYSSLSAPQWNSLLAQRLEHLFDLYRPSAVLYDGTHPYSGLCRVLDRHPELARVWLRRAMWRPGIGHEALTRARHFDVVVEPGDFAASNDRGLTVAERPAVEQVGPIRYGPDPWPAAAARETLELEESTPAVLVQLGAGQINDVGSMVSRVIAQLSSGDPVQIVVALSVLSSSMPAAREGVRLVRHYPISELFNAFDFGFFAAGYNSFHEALSIGLPAIFVPNVQTRLDDQAARTRYAHEAGLALEWDGQSDEQLREVVGTIESPARRAEMRARMAALPPADGAGSVADVITRLLERVTA